jgi:hypothetical protein
MGDVIPFRRRQRRSLDQQGRALCSSGHHKWEIVQAQRFDIKQGRLVTVFRCKRCNVTKNEAR